MPGIARAARQYDAADNMTDRMAALATLSLHDVPDRERALADFYTRYAADALVVDKWFSLQAMIPQPGHARQCPRAHRPSRLLDGQSQPRARPDRRLRGRQSTQFNRADGAGYDFVADTVLALDPKNPQLAARLATAFRTWRTLEAGRRAKAEAALNRIKAALRTCRATWRTSSSGRLPHPDAHAPRAKLCCLKVSVGNNF